MKVLFLPDFVFCVYLHMKGDGIGYAKLCLAPYHLQVSEALLLRKSSGLAEGHP